MEETRLAVGAFTGKMMAGQSCRSELQPVSGVENGRQSEASLARALVDGEIVCSFQQTVHRSR